LRDDPEIVQAQEYNTVLQHYLADYGEEVLDGFDTYQTL
jgi:hypothetical protein